MTDGQFLAIGHNKEYWDGDDSKLEAISVCGTDGHSIWIRKGVYKDQILY